MALTQDKPGEKYGFVTYIEQEKPFYKTGAYEGGDGRNEPDPEGEYMYEFQDGAWKWPIYTKRDQEYFVSKPKWFEVQLPGGRPGGRPRPSKEVVEPPKPKEEKPPVETKPVSLKDKLK